MTNSSMIATIGANVIQLSRQSLNQIRNAGTNRTFAASIFQ
jgi:hypothetical protein